MIVIRSCGERTLNACLHSILFQTEKKYVKYIDETPFEKTLIKTFQLGIDSGVEWLITIDADVILFSNALEQLLSEAAKMPETYVQIGARIFDKVFGIYRRAGIRVYRGSMLQKAICLVPSAGTEIRPESALLEKMGKLGHPSRYIGYVGGVHDYEQYYCDIYRKAYIHGHKHEYHAIDLLKRCLRKMEDDTDFAVILRGFCDGLIGGEKATIDARRFHMESRNAIADLNLKEKAPLESYLTSDWNEWALSKLEFDPPEYITQDMHPPPTIKKGFKNRFDELIFKYGVLEATKYSLGAALEQLGKNIKEHKIRRNTLKLF